MTEPMSVFDKAQAFRAEANRVLEGAQAHEEATRVSNRIDETLTALDRLDRVVAAARQLRSVANVTLDVSKARGGRDQFARLAVGLPVNQVFTTAQRKIKGAEDAIAAEVASAWATWTGQQLQALPLLRMALLAGKEQEAAKRRTDELKRLARKPLPTPTDVSLFSTSCDLLAESLEAVPDPPPEVVDLLRRLEDRPALTLADLTDEQIRLLREAGISDQIEVHRRGV